MKKFFLIALCATMGLVLKAQTPQDIVEKFDCGELVTIQATAHSGYHFVRWSDGVTDAERTINLAMDTALTAIFAHNDLTISFTVDANIGEVQDAQGNPIAKPIAIPFGEKRTVKAVVKDDCYEFAGWFKSGEQEPFKTDDELEIEGVEDLTIEAHFVKKQFEVKVSLDAASTGMGTITLSKVE